MNALLKTHTPGPWRNNGCQITAQGDLGLIVAVALSESDVLANRYSGHAAKTQADGIANARLIAAAPELLEALIELHKHFITDNEEVQSDTRLTEFERLETLSMRAIAKAKGEA